MPNFSGLNYRAIAKEFMRSLRGRRSQVAFSRRLGFASNVAAEWESGRRIPPLTTALSACRHSGIDMIGAFSRFWPPSAPLLGELTVTDLARWLDAQRGKEAVSRVAVRSGLSRYQTTRILAGRTEPRLHQFFALVHACTARLSDLIAECVDIDSVETLKPYHERTTISRRLAFDEPWTSALLAALESISTRDRARAESVLAEMFGLPETEVRRYLTQMVQAGVVARRNKRYVLAEPLLVDTGTRTEAARQLTHHWAEVGAKRSTTPGKDDVFSFNVFSVSHADYQLIAQMQREHFQRVRALVAKSVPQTVAVMNLQLLGFAPTDAKERASGEGRP